MQSKYIKIYSLYQRPSSYCKITEVHLRVIRRWPYNILEIILNDFCFLWRLWCTLMGGSLNFTFARPMSDFYNLIFYFHTLKKMFRIISIVFQSWTDFRVFYNKQNWNTFKVAVVNDVYPCRHYTYVCWYYFYLFDLFYGDLNIRLDFSWYNQN